MVIINNKLYLSVKNLIPWGFTQSFIDKQTSIGEYPSVYGFDPEQPNRKEIKLIAYDGIPEKTRIEKGLPPKEQLLTEINQRQITSLVTFSNEAYEFYLNQPPTHKVAKQKAEQASWLIAIASTKPTQCKALGFANKEEFYDRTIVLMNEQAASRGWYPWKLSTVAELVKRLTPFKKYLKGEITLAQACGERITKKAGNHNAAKLGVDQQALLIQLYSDANAKPNYEQVWMFYTRKATEMVKLGNWSQDTLVSPSTVRAFLTKPDIRQLCFEARHGKAEYRNIFDPVIQRERPSFANALWVVDGTPSHRYFFHKDHGRYFRVNIFPVVDAHSWAVLGFWLDAKETTDLVLNALRSACMLTGTMPHQILFDNSSAIKSYRAQEAIHKISVWAYPAKAGNARSKVIENFFHHFNQDVQKFRPGYTANPFALRLDNRPNREALAEMVKSEDLVSAEMACKQMVEDLTIWNNTPRKFLNGKTPIQVYRESVKATQEKQRPFSRAIEIDAFWNMPGEQKKIRTMQEGQPALVSTFVPQEYEFTNRGIDITIRGKRFTYDVEEAEFRTRFIGQKFTVKYDPTPERWSSGQPDELLLYVQGKPLQWKGVHVAALPKQLMPMAIADYRQGSRAALDGRLTCKKIQRAMVQRNFEEIIEHTKKNGTYTPVITSNAFDKEVLQDSGAELRDQLILGEDYSLLDGPKDDTDESQERTDRLTGYDKDDFI